MRRLWLVLLGLLLSLGISGCVARPTPTPPPQPALPDVTEKVVEKPAVSALPEGGMPKTEDLTAVELPVERRIIYEATLVLVVQDTERAAQQVIRATEALGGYVVNATLYRVDSQVRGNITVRVPQERFEDALARFRELAVRVDREERSTQDVTTEYVDLEARLQNLQATEQELRALLREVRQRTQQASDIMEVYRELTRVREEIERIKGRMQVLDRLTAYATIDITLQPYELSQPVSQRWDPRITLRRAWSTLLRAGQVLVDAVIYLVVVGLPLAVAVGIPAAGLVVLVRRLRRRP